MIAASERTNAMEPPESDDDLLDEHTSNLLGIVAAAFLFFLIAMGAVALIRGC